MASVPGCETQAMEIASLDRGDPGKCDAVTLQVGTFSITIPPGSFTKQLDGSFFLAGVINGVSLKARIRPTATLQHAFHAKAQGASLTGTTNPVYVTLIIGGDSGGHGGRFRSRRGGPVNRVGLRSKAWRLRTVTMAALAFLTAFAKPGPHPVSI
jgi:hypothetical protein